LSATIELTVDAKEPCESGNKPALDQILLKIIVPMFNHFDMISNLGDDFVSNDLFHVCLFKHVVACKFETMNVYSSMLGWFNDEHCQPFDINTSFTYMCKMSCNIFMPFTSRDDILALYVMTFEECSCINVSRVNKRRKIKMDDLYIYNVYTLSLLLATFQIKQRR